MRKVKARCKLVGYEERAMGKRHEQGQSGEFNFKTGKIVPIRANKIKQEVK